MTIDFTLEPIIQDLIDRTRAFVAGVVIPAEEKMLAGSHGVTDTHRVVLQSAARDAGIFAPHVAEKWGGLGLDMRDRSLVFEEAGYSLLGPHALNCAAPDEANMHLLEQVATPEQKQHYLAPLAAGEVRSCFAMTEPSPGAGADPSMLQTTARQAAGGWVIDGHKWFITGAEGAAYVICMAKTLDVGPGAATMFIVDADNPGFQVGRQLDTLDAGFAGGHYEVHFENCKVADAAILGTAGEGFAYAQVRLAPGRLTHCMRWLGIARRAQEVAVEVAATRRAFGTRLGELGMAQQMLADNEIDLAASRALILQTAWVLDRGEKGAMESSIAKTFVSEAVNRVVDRSVQLAGARGISGDLPLARFLREIRPFRIYDGPSETHRWSIARRVLRAADAKAGRHE
ncbi:MAG: acyl-CoA dehydrogenase family protein [Acidimicrobiales bacterium]